MTKITMMGAGSTIFAKNVLGDCMCTPALQEAHIALYDIDKQRLDDSFRLLSAVNRHVNDGRATLSMHLGPKERKNALRGADFVVNAVQVGGYEPATVADFEIPKKYGLRQTIGDTIGIGGIFRALRTIPVLQDFAEDMQEVCPDAWLLNYANPMAMLAGYMLRYTPIRTVGLCHSVQVCVPELLKKLNMEAEGHQETIAGINHMGWLLDIRDREENDLYPEIRRRAAEKNAAGPHDDSVRFEYIRRFGYYCTESSEHNAEYNPFFIKRSYPELIDTYSIPLDEYPRRCVRQIREWTELRDRLLTNPDIGHERSREYASAIMEAMVQNRPFDFGGNVLNDGFIDNLPREACVEVPCRADGTGIHGQPVGHLPEILAAMNRTNMNVHLLTIEAAVTKRRDAVYQAAMLDPHTAAELSMDDIVRMCDDLLDAHKAYLPEYR